MIKIKKGLELPIIGEPEQMIYKSPLSKKVALVGDDYMGMKPTMACKVGDTVKKGELLFTDKKVPEIRYTAPAGGKVVAINRGARRVFQSIEIEIDGPEEEITFDHFGEQELAALDREKVKGLLLESGMWTAFRQRPYSKVAHPGELPHSIFVTAIDTNPLAPKPSIIIHEKSKAFIYGLTVIRKLTEGKVFLCKSPDEQIPGTDTSFVETHVFEGPHPAGNVGTHIHFLDPVHANKTVWHIGYQDVIAIGNLFVTGKLDTDRIVALSGDRVEKPRLLKTRVGASISDLIVHQLYAGENRIISGSVFNGRVAKSPFNYLGRYHNQITVIEEGYEKIFLGWKRPRPDLFSIKNLFVSKLIPHKKFNFTTTTNGSSRAMVPIGAYEKVMPLDILPTQLLRALLTKDTDMAQDLGCLELDEEDLSLCTFVCSGKHDFGKVLRSNLEIIEKEG